MKFKKTGLNGNFLIDLEKREDRRGFFARYYCAKEFSAYGLNTNWLQINNSLSYQAGTLRGLHFQKPPYAEVKLVRCLKGAVWDVVVDLRRGSKTYGKWFGSTLSEENRSMMYVPRGFAHGFQSLMNDSEILYLVSDNYEPNAEVTLLWDDSSVNINWPMHPAVISDKDARGITLNNIEPLEIMIYEE